MSLSFPLSQIPLPNIGLHSAIQASGTFSLLPLLAVPAEAIISTADNDQDNQNIDISIPQAPRDSASTRRKMKGQRTRRLMADYEAAAKQVDEKDINDPEKIDWLLSKLELDQDEKDGLVNLLQEQANSKTPGEALGQWKMLVVTIWAESDKLIKEEQQEENEQKAKEQD